MSGDAGDGVRGDRTEGDDHPDPERNRVALAQGTFDLLHPGHVHYLREAADHGDELHVIVARGGNVTHKEAPVCPDRQRRDMVDALGVVDEAHLGHAEDFYVPVRAIDPDVVVLGFDQHHEVDAIRSALDERGLDADVVRASGREPRYEGEILSTNRLIERLLDERG
ncbi:adenylyltransferase/cytidyltransferase family protein [Candidatus Halobonum tyrrellensis]|uniref:FAD synthase n=1 Tax=Candidatus Halobonum tyrrellensis G22 TaxID=1324957 RepID=V4HFJ2_9EURY|nr:adenylyltransferase/cytidyltransferase family protein [Candidatus Halobonum tyrrellensis]ESP88843.1 fmn adenylyltransferase [Candidatus Halobonum tyrrellensis G22]